MAQVDVTDVLSDPDFTDPVTIIHRASIVDAGGNNVLTETPVCTYGCVQPASGKTIQRLPDELQMSNVSSFWVKGKIISDGKNKYPDIICFQGQRYEVQIIFDFTNWGAGWCEGVCVREKAAL